MSFKISDEVIIDASRNLSNVGIITATDFRKADGSSIGGGLANNDVSEGYIITNPKVLNTSVTLPFASVVPVTTSPAEELFAVT